MRNRRKSGNLKGRALISLWWHDVGASGSSNCCHIHCLCWNPPHCFRFTYTDSKGIQKTWAWPSTISGGGTWQMFQDHRTCKNKANSVWVWRHSWWPVRQDRLLWHGWLGDWRHSGNVNGMHNWSTSQGHTECKNQQHQEHSEPSITNHRNVNFDSQSWVFASTEAWAKNFGLRSRWVMDLACSMLEIRSILAWQKSTTYASIHGVLAPKRHLSLERWERWEKSKKNLRKECNSDGSTRFNLVPLGWLLLLPPNSTNPNSPWPISLASNSGE